MNERTRVVLALGTAQTLAWASSYYVPAILAQPMAEALGLSLSTVFAAFSAALLLTAALGPAAGRAIDRRGGRDVLALSNLVLAAGLVGLGLADGPLSLFAAWAVMGAGMSIGLYDAGFATLGGLYGREARAPITGITLIAGFASTIGWPLSAWLEARYGWRETCFVWAALHIVFGLPLNRLLIPLPRAPVAEPRAGAASSSAADAPAGGRRIMLLLAFAFAATWFVTSALAAHLPLLLQAAGATKAAAIAAGALVGPAQVAARLVEFSVLRRMHPLISARIAAAMHPIGAAVLGIVGGPAAAAFTLLHGGGNGVLTIAKGTLPLAIFGPQGYGLRLGLLGAPARALQATAPFLCGLIIERIGAHFLWVSAGLSLAALAAFFAIRRPNS